MPGEGFNAFLKVKKSVTKLTSRLWRLWSSRLKPVHSRMRFWRGIQQRHWHALAIVPLGFFCVCWLRWSTCFVVCWYRKRTCRPGWILMALLTSRSTISSCDCYCHRRVTLMYRSGWIDYRSGWIQFSEAELNFTIDIQGVTSLGISIPTGTRDLTWELAWRSCRRAAGKAYKCWERAVKCYKAL